jgi:hypothetical protein
VTRARAARHRQRSGRQQVDGRAGVHMGKQALAVTVKL